jgi:hypothetical protein
MAYFKKHLIPSLEILAFISLLWLIQKAPFFYFFELFLGFIVGNLILELDHLVYWYFLEPNSSESLIAKDLVKQKKLKKIIKLIGDTAQFHTSLIFHHITFQLVLVFISFFIFTSTPSLTAKSIVLFANINLLTKQLYQLAENKLRLQKWLFARLNKQLPVKKIQYYIFLITAINLIFLVKLIGL